VSSVQKASPAAKAGIEPGDVIMKFNGVAITRSSDLPSLVASLRAGSTAKIEVWRDGKTREVTAQLAEREMPKNMADAGDDDAAPQGKLGLAVQPGDVILSVNRTPVKNPAQLRELVGKSGKTVALLIQREDAQIFVPVRIG
jgi:serine protease Do